MAELLTYRVGDAEFVAGLGCRGHPTWGEVANWARILSDDSTAGGYALFAVRPAGKLSEVCCNGPAARAKPQEPALQLITCARKTSAVAMQLTWELIMHVANS